jgi:hypothetical protein
MRKITFSKLLFTFFAVLGLICVPNPAFAQHGGGGHGGGGGGFHGGGGGGGGHFSGGGSFSGGGMRGGGPSGRSFSGPSMGAPMGRGFSPGFSGRFNPERSSGAPSFNSRSFQHGGGSVAQAPAGTHFGSAARNSGASANRAIADGQWHSFAGAGAAGANHATADGQWRSVAGAGAAGTNRAIADGQWHSFAETRSATGSIGSARAPGNAGARNLASAHGGSAGAAPEGTLAASSGRRASLPSLSSNARSSSISPGRTVSNMQGSRMNGSALAGLRSVAPMSAGSSLRNLGFSHTGVNNSPFASAHLGSSSMAGRSTLFTGSTFGDPFRVSGFNRGFGNGFFFNRGFGNGFFFNRGFGNGFFFNRGFGREFFIFDDFRFRCFGCGFGFGFGPGFGFGFGWGWGGWWDPWWWDPWWWWEPSPGFVL